MPIDLIAELEWRGMLKDVTDRDGLRRHLSTGTRRIYAGLDPTANSLTIGNLVTIMALAHAKRAGHEAVVVIGGGTGLIGDPSGKSAERTLMTRETVLANVEGQRPIYERVLGPVQGPPHVLVNNLDWLGPLSYLDALRDIGKHFSVNMMIQKESVRARLEDREHGISYTEFSYMILQAYDFLHLFREMGVTVQFGGSDQFGNIVAGIDLIRRTFAAERDTGRSQRPAVRDGQDTHTSFGLTWPLVTKADGGKFGKTETGAIWLTPDRTSPYAYYQFWLNATDADAVNWLKVFTFLSKDEIESIVRAHEADPGKREAQRALARAATTIVHGREAMEQAEAAGAALFSGEVASLDEATLREVFENVPRSEHSRVLLGAGIDPVDLLVETQLARSKREAREFLGNGSVSVNGQKIGPETRLNASHLLHGSMMAIRRGKKQWHLAHWA
ncbi:MAG: tyrosine--tRNA ligase [Phycisphaerales bacterium]|nr:tyrosine--tRNA ligase [Phycisphaerales bacterium]